MQEKDRRKSGEDEEVEIEVFGRERDTILLRKIGEKWEKFVLNLYIENHKARWIERCQEVSSFKTQELANEELLRIYQEVPTKKGTQWIGKLSSIYRASRNFRDGSSSCRATIKIESQESRWIEIAIIAIKKGSSKGSIDSLVVERYREAVEIA